MSTALLRKRFHEGAGYDAWRLLGAHPQRGGGYVFRLWAPGAREVYVEGAFSAWQGVPMLRRDGLWECTVVEAMPGQHYKFSVCGADGQWRPKADPFAFAAELRPGDASILAPPSRHRWGDAAWLRARAAAPAMAGPLAIYELHAGSWDRGPDGTFVPWSALAPRLIDHVRRLGFSHVELLPVMEHPYDPSWGYQVTGYFAPTARHGSADELRAFVDALHRAGIGVIVDWVPAHFPRDLHGLGRFDGTPLFEYADPRLGEHPDWGTYVFDYTRPEVRSFLLASACYWLEEYHFDGLRFDAVASMLYRDYSRPAGAWVANVDGGTWSYEAISLLQEINRVVHARVPGALTCAEESTSFPRVTTAAPSPPAPPDAGLGFDAKWNLGWMHDTLGYLQRGPEHRAWHHHELTFPAMWLDAEAFVLPLSHDEVVHGKGALLRKMGGRWQDGAAQLRLLLGWQWMFPGKKLLFMGAELMADREWDVDSALPWARQDEPLVVGLQAWIAALNHAYRALPALHDGDRDKTGIHWLAADDKDHSAYAFLRRRRAAAGAAADADDVLVIASFSDLRHPDWALRLPGPGRWRLRACSAQARFGGAEELPELLEVRDVGGGWVATLDLPPFALSIWLRDAGAGAADAGVGAADAGPTVAEP